MAAAGLVEDEIPRPGMVFVLRLVEMAAVGRASQAAFLSLLHQAFSVPPGATDAESASRSHETLRSAATLQIGDICIADDDALATSGSPAAV